jgi:hypothetical protein
MSNALAGEIALEGLADDLISALLDGSLSYQTTIKSSAPYVR